MQQVREQQYSGTWYINNQEQLKCQLDLWFEQIKYDSAMSSKSIKSIIVPHSGFSQSGLCQAHSYKYLLSQSLTHINKIFILAPLHFIYTSTSCLPIVTSYQTPFGDLHLDLQIIQELRQSGLFQDIDKDADEDEYSIELQLAQITYCFQDLTNINLIPIYIGNIDKMQEIQYVELLQQYYERKDSLFIVSSDFIHWGPKYNYTFYDQEFKDVDSFIESQDDILKEFITDNLYEDFNQHVNQNKLIICGKNAISIIMQLIHNYKENIQTKFLMYKQQNVIQDLSDTSISFFSCIQYEN